MASQRAYDSFLQEELHPHHNTHLHAGAGSRGWPHDHSVEDAYEVPPFTWREDTLPKIISHPPTATETDEEFRAEWTPGGGAVLVKISTQSVKRTIANFDTHADAVKAAEALNNHEGY